MKIYLDYDDTIVDLINPTLAWMELEKGVVCKKEEMTSYNYLPETHGLWVKDYWQTPGNYFKDIFPLVGAIEFVELLKEAYGEENIFIVTRACEAVRAEKAEHAEYHFGIDPRKVKFNWNKYEVTKKGVLIDDHIDNVMGHITNNLMPGILFNYKNQNPWVHDSHDSEWIRHITTYDDVLTSLENIHENIARITGNRI